MDNYKILVEQSLFTNKYYEKVIFKIVSLVFKLIS